MSFTTFLRRNKAFARLAILTNLEYRLNFLTDALLQPILAAAIELALWYSLFASADVQALAGFPKSSYLAYAFWAPFVARISANWMYEFRMTAEVESGSINGLLVRPMSFFEYYLSQLLGYKVITTAVSFMVPLLCLHLFGVKTYWERLPLMLLLVGYYLVFVYTMSFIVATVAFHLTRIHSLTVAKNLALWILSGELIPLDLYPEYIRSWLLKLPFCNAVYVPVAYITGRIDHQLVLQGFVSTSAGIIVLGGIGWVTWRRGVKKYVGTGA